MAEDGPPLTTVVRAFDTLEVLWRLDGAGVTEVADQLDLPKSTVHGYLDTLEATGYVVKDGGEYELGLELLGTGSRIKYRKRLFHVAKHEIRELAVETEEVANVTVEERGRAVILHSEESREGLNLGTYPGLSTPIHSHAAGKVILAGRSREYVEYVLERHGLAAVTEKTVTDREELFERLDAIASDGYAVDWDEHVVGMGLVAVPIEVDDEVLGSITVVCPTARLTDPDERDRLVEEARNVSNVVEFNYKYGP